MRTVTKNLLLLIWAFFSAIAVAEVTLAIFDLPRIYNRHSSPPQFQFFAEVEKYQDIGYVNKPSTTIRYMYDGNPRGYFGPRNEVDHTTNSMGFRTRQDLPKHDERTFRIVFLGDSFTFGEGVKDGDTYPEQVEEILSERFPGTRVQSLNLGIGGYNTTQEAEMLRLFGVAVEPDLVVLGYTTNDAHPMLFAPNKNKTKFVRQPPTPLNKLARQPNRPPDTFLYNNSRIARMAWSALAKHRGGKALEIYRSMYRDDSPGWQDTQRALGRISNICHKRQIPCISAVFPVLLNLDSYPLQAEHNRILSVMHTEGFKVVDLLPAIRSLGLSGPDLWVHPTDQHPNEVVHRRVAESIASYIVDSGMMERYSTAQAD